jgi:hypothetical protein
MGEKLNYMSKAKSDLELQTKYDEATRQAVEILKVSNPVRIIRFGSAVLGPASRRERLGSVRDC